MSIFLQPLQLLFAELCKSIRKEQEKVIEYLQLENQVLREQAGGKRVLITDDQRRLLAVKGKALGRQQLGKIATIAQADTILRWHRELIEPNGSSKASHNTGRPPIDQEVVKLVLRMASENVSWGYKRIEGALRILGYSICSSTVANILKQHGIEPAPSRQRTTSWSTFLKAHWDTFEGIDLVAIGLWIMERLNSFFGKNSHGEAILHPAAVASQDVTHHMNKQMIHIHISIAPATETHQTRAPPVPARILSSISLRKIRHAA